MARTVRNAKIDTRSGRAKLAERREPYWTVISAGCAIGYRRGRKGGTWIARMRAEEGQQHYEALGAADDSRDADGLTVFTFAQAQDLGRQFFARTARVLAGHAAPQEGPCTVAMALEAYFAAREQRGSRGVKADKYAADAHIVPDLGALDLDRLTARRIREWHTGLASSGRRLRTGAKAEKQALAAVDASDPDAVRARRSSANRILTILKAALNHEYQEGRVASDEAWRKVKPFRGVDAAVVRYLTPAECIRLVNACDVAFRNLVRGALVTGCRYGELTRMRAADFNPDSGTVAVRQSKSGKARHVALTVEGQRHFATMVAGRGSRDLVFLREDGDAWGASHQQRPLEEASKRAKLNPSATFHVLRHTYASTLAMKGVPMGVIAAQLGHADTRMTERHYAHLAPSYVADTVRAALPSLGIVEPGNVVPLRQEASS